MKSSHPMVLRCYKIFDPAAEVAAAQGTSTIFMIVGASGLTLAVTRALEMWGSSNAGDVWLRLSSWNWCWLKFSWRLKVLNIIDPLKIEKLCENLLFQTVKPFQDHFGKRDPTSIKCQMLIGFYRDATSFRGTFFLLHLPSIWEPLSKRHLAMASLRFYCAAWDAFLWEPRNEGLQPCQLMPTETEIDDWWFNSSYGGFNDIFKFQQLRHQLG